MNPFKNQFITLFNSLSHRHSRHNLFSDFVTCAAISIHNAVSMDEEPFLCGCGRQISRMMACMLVLILKLVFARVRAFTR